MLDETQPKSIGGHLGGGGGGVTGNCRSNAQLGALGGRGNNSVLPSGEDVVGDKVSGNIS